MSGEHLPDERLAQLAKRAEHAQRNGEVSATEQAHLDVCGACRAQLEEARVVARALSPLAFLAPGADFVRRATLAFEAAWTFEAALAKKRARECARALAAGALLSLAASALLAWWLPFSAFNLGGRTLAGAAQAAQLVMHFVRSLQTVHAWPVASTALLSAITVACVATTWLLERSVRLGRRNNSHARA